MSTANDKRLIGRSHLQGVANWNKIGRWAEKGCQVQGSNSRNDSSFHWIFEFVLGLFYYWLTMMMMQLNHELTLHATHPRHDTTHNK